jgi:hypothetical protein
MGWVGMRAEEGSQIPFSMGSIGLTWEQTYTLAFPPTVPLSPFILASHLLPGRPNVRVEPDGVEPLGL